MNSNEENCNYQSNINNPPIILEGINSLDGALLITAKAYTFVIWAYLTYFSIKVYLLSTTFTLE